MESVAWLAGENATDAPECACPVLGRFAITINDRLDDENRQSLLPLALDLVGTRSKDFERVRADFLVMQVGTKIVPQAFDLIGLTDIANELRACKTKAELFNVANNAKRAADAANAADAADAAADAADAAANAAYAAANAAYAADAANAVNAVNAKQKILVQCVPILEQAILLGPNGREELERYRPRIKELGKFATNVLAGA